MLFSVRISSYGCTWEVWRTLKKLKLLSAAPRATLTHFSFSPNFPRASITRYKHAKHEQILKVHVVYRMITPLAKRLSSKFYVCPRNFASRANVYRSAADIILRHTSHRKRFIYPLPATLTASIHWWGFACSRQKKNLLCYIPVLTCLSIISLKT